MLRAARLALRRRVAMALSPLLLAVFAGCSDRGGAEGRGDPAGDGAPAAVARFLPRSGSSVVETLRYRPLDRTDIEFRQWRARLRTRPDDAGVAQVVAERAVEIARRDGDPRYLGFAEAALAPWWRADVKPTGVRLAKATVLQGVHRFDDALLELAPLTERPRASPQAWLTQAAILQVQGRYAEAAQSCAALVETSPEASIYGLACLAELRSLSVTVDSALGDRRAPVDESCRRGANSMQRLAALTRASAASRDGAEPWLQLMLAELAARLGEDDTAEAAFRRALLLQPEGYSKGAWADFLLDHGRAAEVLPLLARDTRNDALLLRLALAQQALGDPGAASSRAALRARFDAARLRGDTLHRREAGHFALALEHAPHRALALASQNWRVQKEPADARLLLEAARAAGDRDAARPVRDFLLQHRPCDLRLSAATR